MSSISLSSTASAERPKVRRSPRACWTQTQSMQRDEQKRARKRGSLWRGHSKASL